jgi:hypothetical protein
MSAGLHVAARQGLGADLAGFQAADAALTGFRVVWERPWAVAIWAGLQFVISLGFSLFIALTAGPAFDKAAQFGFDTNPQDLGPIMEVFRQVAPTYVVIVPLLMVFYAVLWAAMNRAVMRPQASAYGYLRLSSDELRQLGLIATLLGLALLLEMVVAVVAGMLGFAVAAVAGPVGPALMFALLLVGVAGAGVFVGVRLSLASALTFSTRNIDLVGAWRLTRGRFWPLLGVYAIAFALYLVVMVLTFAIAVALAAILGGGLGALSGVMQGGVGSVAAILTPGRLVYLVVSSVGSALGFPVTMTPPAAIYRAIDGGRATGRIFE